MRPALASRPTRRASPTAACRSTWRTMSGSPSARSIAASSVPVAASLRVAERTSRLEPATGRGTTINNQLWLWILPPLACIISHRPTLWVAAAATRLHLNQPPPTRINRWLSTAVLHDVGAQRRRCDEAEHNEGGGAALFCRAYGRLLLAHEPRRLGRAHRHSQRRDGARAEDTPKRGLPVRPDQRFPGPE
eukprot:scaffold98814_cov73-Phaeocystis_antarctica.AAC.8